MTGTEYPIYNGKQPFTAGIVCNNALRFAELEMLAAECGFSTSDNLSILEADDQTAKLDVNDYILIDFFSVMERPNKELKRLSSYISSSGVTALVWTDMDGMEKAYAILPVQNCHFMIGPSDAEAMLMLTSETVRGKMNQLNDKTRDEGYQELHKISSELADVVKTLSQMAAGEDASETDNSNSSLNEGPVSFRPSSIITPLVAQDDKPEKINDDVANLLSAKRIRQIIKIRRLREDFFESNLFADPAWDILLDLMAARIEQNKVSVSSLCIAAAVPPTTALRWITSMTNSGILIRQQDPNDARRVFLELSDETALSIEAYFLKASEVSGKEE